jgi:CspA family cold shock protein
MSDEGTGTVKFFNEEKGYGFITREGQDDIFVHITNIPSAIAPVEGDKVVFEVGAGRKGPEAVNCRVV